MERELTPKQQTSEAIRQAETILIMTGQHPSIDQVASTVALAALLRKFGKKVTAVISDEIPAGAKFLPTNLVERTLGGLRDFILRLDLSHAEVDKLKYTIEQNKLNINVTPFAGGFQQRDVSFGYGDYQFDVVLILGVASYARIDKVYAQNAELLRQIPLVNIDFHRSNEQYGAINLVEGTAASLSEILIALSESLQSGMIDEQIATTMLTGIMAATDRFTATHTTAKTMTVAAQMMAMGADQQKVVKGLYRDNRDRLENRDRTNKPAPRDTAAPASTRPAAPVSAAPARPARPEAIRPASNQTYQQAAPAQPAAAASQPAQPTTQPVAVTPALPASPAPTTPEPQPAPNLSELSTSPASTPASANDKPTDTPLAPSSPVVPGPTAASTRPSAPVSEPATLLEELLPPRHIEISEAPAEPGTADAQPRSPVEAPADASVDLAGAPTPEPLINDTSDVRPTTPVARPNQNRAASNPTNNPVFAQRLDEFQY